MSKEIKRTRMYEPWGYRDQDNYASRRSGSISLGKPIYYIEYNYKDNLLHFYDSVYKELDTLDVSEFKTSPSPIESTEYNPTTKVLTIKFENGETESIALDKLVESIERDIENVVDQEKERAIAVETVLAEMIEAAVSGATSAETALQEQIDTIKENTFYKVEYVLDSETNKMNINFMNVDDNIKGSVELFDTDDEGRILLDAGTYEN